MSDSSAEEEDEFPPVDSSSRNNFSALPPGIDADTEYEEPSPIVSRRQRSSIVSAPIKRKRGDSGRSTPSSSSSSCELSSDDNSDDSDDEEGKEGEGSKADSSSDEASLSEDSNDEGEDEGGNSNDESDEEDREVDENEDRRRERKPRKPKIRNPPNAERALKHKLDKSMIDMFKQVYPGVFSSGDPDVDNKVQEMHWSFQFYLYNLCAGVSLPKRLVSERPEQLYKLGFPGETPDQFARRVLQRACDIDIFKTHGLIVAYKRLLRNTERVLMLSRYHFGEEYVHRANQRTGDYKAIVVPMLEYLFQCFAIQPEPQSEIDVPDPYFEGFEITGVANLESGSSSRDGAQWCICCQNNYSGPVDKFGRTVEMNNFNTDVFHSKEEDVAIRSNNTATIDQQPSHDDDEASGSEDEDVQVVNPFDNKRNINKVFIVHHKRMNITLALGEQCARSITHINEEEFAELDNLVTSGHAEKMRKMANRIIHY